MSLYTIEHVFRRKVLKHHLQAHGRNITQAAKSLGIRRDYLSRLMRRYGVVACLFGYVLFFASGCAVMSQDLVKDGSTIRCAHFGFGALGTPIAIVAQGSCIKNAEHRGYAKVEAVDVR